MLRALDDYPAAGVSRVRSLFLSQPVLVNNHGRIRPLSGGSFADASEPELHPKRLPARKLARKWGVGEGDHAAPEMYYPPRKNPPNRLITPKRR